MHATVSVVIATRNRGRLLARTLAAIAGQQHTLGHVEVLVADNGSRDDTAAVVQAFAHRSGSCLVRYLYVALPGKSRAVNAALREVHGDIVVFTDDDVQADESWLARLAQAFDDPQIDFVAGRILPEWEVNPPSWLSPAVFGALAIPDGGDQALRIHRGLNEHIMPIGANMAVRASVLRAIGGLREDLGKLDGTLQTGEDHEFFLRLLHRGCSGLYEPDAVVRHWVPRERLKRSYFRRWLYQNGRDVARLQTAFPKTGRQLLGVPGYLWRDAFVVPWTFVGAVVAGDTRRRLAASLRLVWLAGFARQTWLGRSSHEIASAGSACVSSGSGTGAVGLV